MTRSGYIWDWSFDRNRVYPHDAFGRPALGGKPGEGNAAWSLQTTAADFARFLLNVLDGSRLQPETAQAWLRPHIDIHQPRPQSLAPVEGEVAFFGSASYSRDTEPTVVYPHFDTIFRFW
jgi:hypothetical protein